jgi:hypothetical protein
MGADEIRGCCTCVLLGACALWLKRDKPEIHAKSV